MIKVVLKYSGAHKWCLWVQVCLKYSVPYICDIIWMTPIACYLPSPLPLPPSLYSLPLSPPPHSLLLYHFSPTSQLQSKHSLHPLTFYLPPPPPRIILNTFFIHLYLNPTILAIFPYHPMRHIGRIPSKVLLVRLQRTASFRCTL